MGDFSNPKDIVYAREMNFPQRKKLKPNVDKEISNIVGFEVLAQDPRLIKLVVEWKRKNNNENTPDNLFTNPTFITELKNVFIKPL